MTAIPASHPLGRRAATGAAKADPLSVLVVDDHRVFTDVLAFALDAEPDLRCVAVANTARDGVAKAAAYHVDVAIVDLRLPDGGGLGVVAELRAMHPTARLIVLTGHARPDLAEAARRAGADAFVAKDDALRSVLDAIRGDRPDPPPVVRPVVDAPRLRPREQEVLTLLASGVDARRIARELRLSMHTVRGYIKTILAALGAHSQLDAVVAAERLGLVGLGEHHR